MSSIISNSCIVFLTWLVTYSLFSSSKKSFTVFAKILFFPAIILDNLLFKKEHDELF